MVISHHVNWKIPEEAVLMGMMPVHFLNAALWDLKKDPVATWKSILNKSNPITKTEKVGAGVYHKFKFAAETQERTYMSKLLEHSVQRFKVDFLVSALNITDPAEQSKWKIVPEIVVTNFADKQNPHFDLPKPQRKQSYMIHISMQREGSFLSIFDEDTMSHRFVYVPFGTYLALRGDVWHSGFFGRRGNLRLHLVILRGELPEPAILHEAGSNMAQILMAEREVAQQDFEGNNGGKAMHEAFLEWHERQTVHLVEAWERVLAEYNGGERISELLSNLDLSRIKPKSGGQKRKHDGEE